MTSSKQLREQFQALCGQLGDDDGLSPRDQQRTFKNHATKHNQTRTYRLLRLCEQVSRTLAYTLPDLSELMTELGDHQCSAAVDSVIPGRTGTLVVNVRTSDLTRRQQRTLLSYLANQEGRLRSEIARAISRKRVPRLKFQLQPNIDRRLNGEGEVSR